MIQGKAKSNLDRAMEAYIQDEVERRMKELTTHVVLDGELIDSDICDISGGEVYIEIKTPVFFGETGQTGFITKETPAKMAG